MGVSFRRPHPARDRPVKYRQEDPGALVARPGRSWPAGRGPGRWWTSGSTTRPAAWTSRPAAPLAPAGGGVPVRQRFNKLWARGREAAAGIPAERGNGRPVTRHTAATTWLAAGVSLAKVTAYLGDTRGDRAVGLSSLPCHRTTSGPRRSWMRSSHARVQLPRMCPERL